MAKPMSPLHYLPFCVERARTGRADDLFQRKDNSVFRSVCDLPMSGDPINPEKNIQVVKQLGEEYEH